MCLLFLIVRMFVRMVISLVLDIYSITDRCYFNVEIKFLLNDSANTWAKFHPTNGWADK